MNRKTILFLHQSAELYGSDKTLFHLAEAISKSDKFKAIVVLPNEGPLKDVLEDKGVQVIICPIVKLSRQMFTFSGLLALPFNLIGALIKLRRRLGRIQVDIVHSNTMAVLLGAFYSKVFGIRHIWHIHEIIEKPRFVKSYFPKFVNVFSDKVVYNSNATMEAFTSQSKTLNHKSITILNGLDRDKGKTDSQRITEIRQELIGADTEIIIGLIGRINKWKGHHLLLEAFTLLNQEYGNLKLVFIGSAPPGQEVLVTELEEGINEKKLSNKAVIIPFQTNIWTIYDSIDISVIPSTEPEPFGLVAVESMLSQKPVIAANHGGVKEIVAHNETGFLFEPNNINELKTYLEKLVINQKLRLEFGENGEIRAKEKFSLKAYIDQFIALYLGV